MTYKEAAEVLTKRIMCDRTRCANDECGGCPYDYAKTDLPVAEDLAIKALEVLVKAEEKE